MLTASLLPSQVGGGDISVSSTKAFIGEDVCSVQLPVGGTLADLGEVLCGPHGPIFKSHPWSRLLFFTEKEPCKPLDLNLQADVFHSLVIKRDVVEELAGKFREAMGSNKFDPNHQILIPVGPQEEVRRSCHES